METPPPAPASASSPNHRVLYGLLLLVAGVAVGAGVVRYVDSMAPAPSVGLPQDESPLVPSAVAYPPASHVVFQPQGGRCAPDADCVYEVRIDQEVVGTITVADHSPYPGEINSGAGWSVFQTPPEGLGGYILYSRYVNLHYANGSGVKLLTEGFTDADFSSDLSQMAYLISERNADGTEFTYRLSFLNLADGTVAMVSGDIPTTAGAQVGLPTYSPDGSRIAVVVGYGPDNERGEIYTAPVSNPLGFIKVADTPRPVSELWWTADGDIAWR